MNILFEGDILFEIHATDEAYRYRAIRTLTTLTLYFSLPEHVEVPVRSYVEYEGQTFTLNDEDNFKKNGTRNFEYTLILDASDANLKKYKARDQSGRLKFSMTAKPHEHLQMVVDNLNQRESGWTIGTYVDATEKVIAYNHMYLIEALNAIADEFNTEWEINGKEISLRRVEYNKNAPLALSYGKGNGFKPGVGRTTEKKGVEVLYVQGGNRNIDASKYGSADLLLPKSQSYTYEGRVYITDADGLYVKRGDKALTHGNEDSLDLTNIYPSRVGTISGVNVVDASKNFYDIIDSSIPGALDYEACLIDGEKMTIEFQTGMLTGKEFEVKYIHADRRFEIVPAEIDGMTMPGGVFVPVTGDKYAVFGIQLPDAYISDNSTQTGSSWDMFKEAVKYLYENEDTKFTFTGEMDGIWAKQNWLSIGAKIRPGGYVDFSDPQFAPDSVLIRIMGVKDYINRPQSPVLELSNSIAGSTLSSDLKKIDSNEVVAENLYKNLMYYTKRRFRDSQETLKMLENAMLEGFGDAISPITIKTMALLIGDESLQFLFVDDMTTPVEVPNNIVYNSVSKVLTCPAGIIQHMTLGINKISPQHANSEYKFWSLPPYATPPLTATDKSYYLYAKVSKTDTAGQYVMSETAIDMEAVSGYYHFLIGILNSEYSGDRSFVTLYGFTEILPGRITTNRIVSSDGQTYFDLENGIIGGRLRFVSTGGVEKDVDTSINNAELSAKLYADAQDLVRKTEQEAYVDGVVSESEAALIASAQAYADLKKAEAQVYADGKVTAEEAARIADATAKFNAAKAYADAQDAAMKIANENLIDDSSFEKGRLMTSLNGSSGGPTFLIQATTEQSFNGTKSIKATVAEVSGSGVVQLVLTTSAGVNLMTPAITKAGGAPSVYAVRIKAVGSAIGKTFVLRTQNPTVKDSETFTLTDQWRMYSMACTVPVGTGQVMYLRSTNSLSVGDVIYIDCDFVGIGNKAPEGWTASNADIIAQTAKLITLSGATQIITVSKTGVNTPAAPFTVTGAAQNTTITAWTYSIDGGSYSSTLPAGITRSGDVVTINPATVTFKTLTIKASDGTYSDVFSVARAIDGKDGEDGKIATPKGNVPTYADLPSSGLSAGDGYLVEATGKLYVWNGTEFPPESGGVLYRGEAGAPGEDGYTIVLGNEFHTFPGTETTAVPGSTECDIIVYKGATPQSVALSVGTLPTGLTASIAGSKITFTASSSLISPGGSVDVTIVTDGKTFVRKFGYAISFKGAPGVDAKLIGLTGATQVISVAKDGTNTPSSSFTVVGTVQNTTITDWTYSVDGGSFSTPPTGVSRSGNTVTVNPAAVTFKTLSIRASDGAYSDTFTIARAIDGINAIVGYLTNESITFSADKDGVVSDFSGTNRIFKVFNGTALASSGVVYSVVSQTGCTVSINASTGAYSISAMSADTASATLRAVYAGVTIDKVLSLSKSKTGATGSQGIPGTPGADGVTTYTWVKYADTPTTGMSDNPTGKAYIGFAYNKTTSTQGTNYADYKWSKTEGAQGIPGAPGADGQTTYTWLKYADTPTSGMSDSSTGKDYIGIAVNKLTATESANYADYVWSKIKGEQGIQGVPGADAPLLYLSSTAEAMIFNADNTPNPASQTITFEAKLQNVSGTATFTAVPYIGSTAQTAITLGGSGNTRTLTQAQWGATVDRIVATATLGSLTDVITIVKLKHGATGTAGSDGQDGYTLVIGNESHTFAGSETAAIAGSTQSQVIIYKGVNPITPTSITIGTMPTGMTASVSGTTITWNVTTALVSASGTVQITVIADGKTFPLRFSYTISFKGAAGANGISITGADVEFAVNTSTTVAPTTGWTTTAPTLTTGQQLWTRTKITYSSGSPTYSTPANITPKAGADGAAGRSIASITEEYYLSTSKVTPTGGSWSTTQPTWEMGKYLCTRVKIVYSNPTTTEYTTPVIDSSWEAVNNVAAPGSLAPDLLNWNIGTQLIATVTDGKEGDRVLRMTTQTPYPQPFGDAIPIDRSKKYKTRFWARRSSDGNGVFFFGLRQFIDNGVTPITANSGYGMYNPSGISLPTTWTLYERIVQGSEFSETAVYFKPAFLGNYGTPTRTGYVEVQGFKIFEYTDIDAAQAAATNAAKTYADAQDILRKTETQAYADGKVTAEEAARIAADTAYLNAAKAYAEAEDALLQTTVQAYADGKATSAESAAIAAAQAYADLKKTEAQAYADGVVTAEESARIADVQAKYLAAKALADAAQLGVDDINNPDKLTPSKKQQMQIEYTYVLNTYTALQSQANNLGISYATLQSAYTTYMNYVNSNNLLASLTTTSNYNGATYRTNLNNYYSQEEWLRNSITNAHKTNFQTAFNNASSALSLANSASSDANTANSNVNNALTYIDRLIGTIKAMGNGTWESFVQDAMNGEEIKIGGYLKNVAIDTGWLQATIVTAAYIEALNVTAKRIRTANSNRRIELLDTDNTLSVYDETGNKAMEMAYNSAISDTYFYIELNAYLGNNTFVGSNRTQNYSAYNSGSYDSRTGNQGDFTNGFPRGYDWRISRQEVSSGRYRYWFRAMTHGIKVGSPDAETDSYFGQVLPSTTVYNQGIITGNLTVGGKLKTSVYDHRGAGAPSLGFSHVNIIDGSFALPLPFDIVSGNPIYQQIKLDQATIGTEIILCNRNTNSTTSYVYTNPSGNYILSKAGTYVSGITISPGQTACFKMFYDNIYGARWMEVWRVS